MKKINILSVLSFALALTLGGAIGVFTNEVNAQTNVNVDVEGEVNTGTNTNTGAESESSAETSTQGSSQGRGSAVLEVDGGDVRADSDSGTNVGVTVSPWQPGQIGVTTVAEVRAFIEAESMRDENIRHVKINEDGSIEVSYARPARFLGIIPAKLATNASVNVEGNTDISFPWYRIFFALTAANVDEAQVSNQMRATASSTVTANGNVALNAAAARIARLIATLRASANAEAESNTNVEAEN